MKPGIILLTALTAFGGWLYVELAPLPANQRMQKFQRLPVVADVIEWSDMREMRAAFEQSESGVISITRRGETTTWDSFEDWKSEFDAFDRDARFWYNKVKNADAFEQLQQEADKGSFAALRTLALMGFGKTDSGTDIRSSLQNGSASGALWARMMDNPSREERVSFMQSRKGILLSAQSMQENFRWPGMSQSEYDQQSRLNQQGLQQLRQQAEAGDPDAKWVWGRLHGDTPTRIRVP